MSFSFNSRWDDFSFDRRDPYRLSLESLENALAMRLVHPVTQADLDWYQDRVSAIFAPHLPPSSGASSTGWPSGSSWSGSR